MDEQAKGYLYGFGAAIFWSVHSVISRYLTQSLPGIAIAVLRLYIAIIALYIILRVLGKPISFRVTNKKWFVGTVCLWLVLNFILFHVGLQFTTASSTMLLENTAPLFLILLLALIFKERAPLRDIAAVLLGIVGVVLVVYPTLVSAALPFQWFGNLLQLGAGLTWAVFILGSSKVFAQEETLSQRLNNLLLIFLASAILLTPIMLLSLFLFPSSIPAHFYVQNVLQSILLLGVMGVFSTAIAYALWYEAARRVSPIASALLFTLTVAFTIINAWLFLHEQLTILLVFGGSCIVAGILLTRLRKT